MSTSNPADKATAAPRRWDVIVILGGTLALALTVAPWYLLASPPPAAMWAVFVVFIAWNGLSITAGYHRLWSHRAYEAHWLLRLVFALGGALSVQNSIREWVSGHRRHHRYVDDPDRDPYAATRGLWFSHVGWMLRDWPSGTVEFDNVKDIDRDPLVTWQHRHYGKLVALTNLALPVAIGAMLGDVLAGLLVLGVLRLVFCHHTTFFINSLAHKFGHQPYSDENTARDNGLLALVTYGEGYHNFHHTFQWDYRNGLRWYQFDPTKWLIRSLSFVGITWGLKRAEPHRIELRRVAMQMKYATRALSAGARFDRDLWLARLEEEYRQLSEIIDEWARCRQVWLAGRQAELRAQFSRAELKHRLHELEESLELHRERWRIMTAQFA